MKALGKHNLTFPETKEELDSWKPTVQYHALARRVLAVARTRCEGAWSAYCDAVPGENHFLERHRVLDQGDKLPESVAQALFPLFEGIPYAR